MRPIRISTPAAALLAAAALIFALGGPASQAAFGTRTASAASEENIAGEGSPYISTHLYFGTGNNGNPPITEEQFMKFVADVITPASPPDSPSRRPAGSGATRTATSTARERTS